MDKQRVIKICDKTIEISLCAVVFYIPISNALIESFAGLAITAWLVKKISAGFRLGRLFPSDFLSLTVLCYAAAMFASAVFSSNHAISLKHFAFKTTEYLLLFFIAAEIHDRRALRNIIVAMLLSAALACVDGLTQYWTHFDFLRHRQQVINGRVNGPFTTPNDFSSYLVTLLPVASAAVFIAFKKKWLKLALTALSFMLFACLILSATRSAWIALLLALPFAALVGLRRLFLVGLLVVTLIICVMPFLPEAAQFRITHFFYAHEAGQYFHRQLLWDMSIFMLAQKPLLGQGLGTFMSNFEKFKPSYYPGNWEISYAHNCLLQIAAETGMLGLLSFVAFVATLFFVCFIRLKTMRRDSAFYVLAGLVTGIFTYLAASFFDTSLYSLSLASLFWLMMGLCAASVKITE